jgi:uncharacterized protein YqeY|tara:strand:+ start:768 stop:1211 length:444 start_codon:yes stop_codon:yes gene_type:complete
MSFIDTIKEDMYTAMKSGEKEFVGTLRTLLAKLKDQQINSGKKLSDQEGLNVIKTLVKQRRESIEMYEQANRPDLAEQEKIELNILESYLPQMMTEDETRSLVVSVIEETGSIGMEDVGKVMPVVMQRGAGSVDGKTANMILRELLE